MLATLTTMTSPRRPVARLLNLGVGLAGALLIAWFVKLSGDVLRGPGDDNPVVLLFYLATLAALVPAWGLLRAAAGWGFRAPRAWLWLVGALAALCLLAPFAWQFV